MSEPYKPNQYDEVLAACMLDGVTHLLIWSAPHDKTPSFKILVASPTPRSEAVAAMLDMLPTGPVLKYARELLYEKPVERIAWERDIVQAAAARDQEKYRELIVENERLRRNMSDAQRDLRELAAIRAERDKFEQMLAERNG